MSANESTGNPKSIRQIEQALRLAITFGHCHAEIVFQARLGVVALLLPDHSHRPPAKPRQPHHQCPILAKQPVAGKRREFIEKIARIIEEMRPAWMARHQRLLPGCELGIGLLDQRIDLALQAADIVLDVHGRVLSRKLLQVHDLAFEVGNRLFEFEICGHRHRIKRTKVRKVSGTWQPKGATSNKSGAERSQIQPLPRL